MLLNEGCDVNAVNVHGDTPLYVLHFFFLNCAAPNHIKRAEKAETLVKTRDNCFINKLNEFCER